MASKPLTALAGAARCALSSRPRSRWTPLLFVAGMLLIPDGGTRIWAMSRARPEAIRETSTHAAVTTSAQNQTIGARVCARPAQLRRHS
jgi:hypothetical protein